MTTAQRQRVVLYWHMHQPHYSDAEEGSYLLPWTYLHAIKDYVDMAAHLEQAPEGVAAVVNFAPTLLEQIDDYSAQVKAHLKRGKPITDPLLAALHSTDLPQEGTPRLELALACTRANEERLIRRFEPYSELVDLLRSVGQDEQKIAYLSDQFLIDLVVWYHLAWLGESVRRDDPRAQRLLEQGNHFTFADRRELLTLIGELLDSVIDRYRHLAEIGRVELSFTPYAHPIAPLLLDMESAREAWPDVVLPASVHYPGGEERVRWHIDEGKRVFRHHFGFDPAGCWPAEGSICDRSLHLLDEAGVRWAASGEGVLRNSIAREGATAGPAGNGLFHPYHLPGDKLATFFRDDGLSDLIGFTYAKWHADDAVADFIQHIENIAGANPEGSDSVITIILDGENAWEYYPENGYYFLSALYAGLSTHPGIELTTFSRSLDDGVPVHLLDGVVAGSWVYGTFSTWIGDRDKNTGWEMLVAAREAFISAANDGRLRGKALAAAERQLAICEGSDWFWWFGDYNPGDAVSDFERLYRSHLRALYRLLGESPPQKMFESFTHGGTEFVAAGGVMRQGQPA